MHPFTHPEEDLLPIKEYASSLKEKLELNEDGTLGPFDPGLDYSYHIGETCPHFHNCPSHAHHQFNMQFSTSDHFDEFLINLGKNIAKNNIDEFRESENIKVERTSTAYYPKNDGFLGWHTNSDDPSWRIYISYVEKEGNTFFKYYDSKTKSTQTSYDGGGFTCRAFKIPEHGELKHCVYTDTERWSFGLKVMKKEGDEE